MASGSWWRGCYTTDPQLKVVLQWLAASQTQSSCLLYYTESVDSLAKVRSSSRLFKIAMKMHIFKLSKMLQTQAPAGISMQPAQLT